MEFHILKFRWRTDALKKYHIFQNYDITKQISNLLIILLH